MNASDSHTRCVSSMGKVESIRVKSVVRIGLAITIPKFANSGMLKENIHTAAPRLPHIVVKVSSFIEEIFFSAKIEVAEEQLAITLGQVTLTWPGENYIQPIVQLVIARVELDKKFLKQLGLVQVLTIDKIKEAS